MSDIKQQKVKPITKMWNAMPWKPIAFEDANLGDFDEAILFGLEELDGNSFLLDKKESGYKLEMRTTLPKKKDTCDHKLKEKAELKIKKKKLKKLRDNKKSDDEKVSINLIPEGSKYWGSILLHNLLHDALIDLGFTRPTPIQEKAIPAALTNDCDIVGAAETGSGKTLAFVLPILNRILLDSYRQQEIDPSKMYQNRFPSAMIIAPTRELALQIAKVLKDICERFKAFRPVSVVPVVGGMAEQKQRRLLGPHSRPPDVVVGTPGRLCEMIQDQEIQAFRDLSRLKFLCVDEADRIVEEGHFPELHRLFSRIREHEKLAESGRDPVQVERQRTIGTYDDDYYESSGPVDTGAENDEDGQVENDEIVDATPMCEGDDDDDDNEFDDGMDFAPMPTDEEIEAARREHQESIQSGLNHHSADEDADQTADQQEVFKPLQRQTLLFSATAICALAQLTRRPLSSTKRDKRNKKLKHLSEDIKALPEHLQELLVMVAIQGNTRVVDVTGVGVAMNAVATATVSTNSTADSVTNTSTADSDSLNPSSDATNKNKKKRKLTLEEEPTVPTSVPEAPIDTTNITLPKGLLQLEIRVPTDGKDTMTYLYLLKHPGRVLIFVNSIKTARRLDGLLRALELNSRTIHAQMQQRQRLRALESYQAAATGILVATDVAARGLDISKIQYVLHYDVARSPQVYIHRSGRTARAGDTGTTISMVAPEDTSHHLVICAAQGLKSLPAYKGDLHLLPKLEERVQLAKKIFTLSFVHSQQTKSASWLQTTAQEAELELDDNMLYELEEDGKHAPKQGQKPGHIGETGGSKKSIDKAKKSLKALLAKPLHESAVAKQMNSSRIPESQKRRGFVVFAR